MTEIQWYSIYVKLGGICLFTSWSEWLKNGLHFEWAYFGWAYFGWGYFLPEDFWVSFQDRFVVSMNFSAPLESIYFPRLNHNFDLPAACSPGSAGCWTLLLLQLVFLDLFSVYQILFSAFQFLGWLLLDLTCPKHWNNVISTQNRALFLRFSFPKFQYLDFSCKLLFPTHFKNKIESVRNIYSAL